MWRVRRQAYGQEMSNDGEIEGRLSHPIGDTGIKTEGYCQGGKDVSLTTNTTTNTLELHLSSEDFENLLKEEKLERQDELYQVITEASEEIEQEEEDVTETITTQHLQLSPSTITPVVVKRKRGRPRKTKNTRSLVGSRQGRKARGRNLTSPAQYNTIEDEGDTDSEAKSKRSRKTKVLHNDYVSDFNTSDEEESEKVFNRFSRRGKGRGRGRGRGKRRNCEFPEAFSDFFSSCNEILGKSSMPIDNTIFKDLDDDDECENEKQNIHKENHEVKDGIDGFIGPGGQTRVQIINTGDLTVIDDQENFIYNIITTTGGQERITPLVIPKMACNMLNKGQDDTLPLPTNTNTDDQGDVKDLFMPGEGVEAQPTSKDTQDSQDKERSLYRQVTSLKQKYYQALQELKKKPQVSTFADLLYGAASFLTDDQLIFFTMQLKSGCTNAPTIKYTVREKTLALAFYLQNADLYKWLSLIFHLPSKVILERWLNGITRNNANDAKRLVYNVYTKYVFRP